MENCQRLLEATLGEMSTGFLSIPNIFGRPKTLLDVQKFVWTSKTFFGRPTICFGRPKNKFFVGAALLALWLPPRDIITPPPPP